MKADRVNGRSTHRKLCIAAGACIAIGAVLSPELCLRQAWAKPPLGETWPAAQRISMDRIDHAPLDALLKKYVDSDGYVDYRTWKASSSDRRALHNYLVQLSQTSTGIQASREAQLAFWINAYNAVTIEGILQVYPTTSIRNHTAKLFGYNIWQDLPLVVGDRAWSLEEIEHKLLRPMGEPRIHFAIVCASVGCPRLRNEAYTADGLEQQLTDNAVDFFSRRQNLRVDTANRTLYLSSILKWFRDDFGGSQAAMLASIKPYLPEAAKRQADDPQTRVEYLDYNWDLNDQGTKPRTASRR